jgi:hypothetical protein
LLAVEGFRFLGPLVGGMLMVRHWGTGDLLLAFESLMFAQQLLSFGVVWAAITEFQAQVQPSEPSTASDQVAKELTSFVGWVALGLCVVLAIWSSYRGYSIVVCCGFALQTVLSLPAVFLEYAWIKRGRLSASVGLILASQAFLALSIFLPDRMNWPHEWTFALLPISSFIRWSLWIHELGISVYWSQWTSVRQRVKRLLPLMGSYWLSGSQLHWAGLVVGWLLAPADFLIYRFGIREVPLVHLMATPIWVRTAEVIARYKSTPTRNRLLKWVELFLKRETNQLVSLGCGFHLVLLVLAPTLFGWVYGSHLQSACLPFQLLLLMPIASAINPRGVILGLDDRVSLLRISFWEAGIHALLSLWLIYLMGVPGVALAMLLSAGIERILLVHRTRQLGLSNVGWIPFAKLLAFLLIALLILTFQHSTWIMLGDE